MNITKIYITFIIFIFSFFVNGVVLADDSPEQKGLSIAKLADDADVGWGSYSAKGDMILRDKDNKESVRSMEVLNYERDSKIEGDWLLIFFNSPLDIKGTVSLTKSRIEPQNDDQWIFLPAEKRVKRISSSNRAGKFVSSEFSFEDLSSQEVADYNYKWLKDEPCPGNSSLKCHVVDTIPLNSNSGYSHRIVWIDSEAYRQWQIQYFNRRGDLEKILNSTEFAKYNNRYWRPSKITMVNDQTGKSTIFIFSNYDFDAKLPESDFNPDQMPSLSN